MATPAVGRRSTRVRAGGYDARSVRGRLRAATGLRPPGSGSRTTCRSGAPARRRPPGTGSADGVLRLLHRGRTSRRGAPSSTAQLRVVARCRPGVRAGPVGSRGGAAPLHARAAVVREAQAGASGCYVPQYGFFELRALGRSTTRSSMAALWMIGVARTEPERSAEICVFEIFGRDVGADERRPSAMGVHPFGDPSITDEFVAAARAADRRPASFHDYAVGVGDRGDVAFFVGAPHLSHRCVDRSRPATRCSSCSTSTPVPGWTTAPRRPGPYPKRVRRRPVPRAVPAARAVLRSRQTRRLMPRPRCCHRTRDPRRTVDAVAVQRRTVGVLSGGVALGGARGDRRDHRRRAAGPRRRGHRHARPGSGRPPACSGLGGARRPARPDQRPVGPPGGTRGAATPSPSSVPRSPCAAAALSSLPLLLVGLFAFGAATACGLQARYAAADLAAAGAPRPRRCPSSSGRPRSARCSAPTSPGPGADLGRALGLPALGGGVRGRGGRLRRRRRRAARCCSGPTRCCSPAGWAAGRRRRRARAGRPGPAVRAVWASPAGRLGLTVGRRLPLGHGRGDGHDAGAHGPRRRLRGDDAARHRPGHQRARRRHVPVLARWSGCSPTGSGGRRRSRSAACLLLAAAALAGTAAPGAAVQLGDRAASCSGWAGRAA